MEGNGMLKILRVLFVQTYTSIILFYNAGNISVDLNPN